MLEKHDHSKDKPASVKNLDKAKAHGCVNACPGCAGFFRSLLSKKARGNFVLMNGGEENVAKIVNTKADVMLSVNKDGAEVFGERTAAAFDKYLIASGIEEGLASPMIGLSIKPEKQTPLDKAVLKYIAASHGKHWK